MDLIVTRELRHMHKQIPLAVSGVSVALWLAGSVQAANPAAERGAAFLAAASGAGAHFESNHGQIPADAVYCFRSAAYRLDLKQRGIELRLPGNEVLLGKPMRIDFSGAGTEVTMAGSDPLPFQVMHRTTTDGIRRGLQPIPTFAAVTAEDVYAGVDVRYHVNRGRLEYDLVVDPGADPSRIALVMTGADSLSLSEAGDLEIEYPVGRVIQHKPHIYQEVEGARETIDGRYVLNGDRGVGLEIGAYDRNLPLVIDPILTVEIRIP